MAIMALMGATVDVGTLALAKARMQAACDFAALDGANVGFAGTDAAAWASGSQFFRDNMDNSGATTITSGSTIDDNNTADHPNGQQYTVGAYTVQVKHPYTDTAMAAVGYNSTYLCYVSASRSVPLPFLSVLGISSATVSARAVALNQGATGGHMAIFAHDSNASNNAINYTGSGGLIQGNMHGNSMAHNTGSAHHITGWWEYVNSAAEGSATVDGGWVLSTVKAYPVTFTLAQFQPYTYVINGDYTFGSNTTVPPGVYYVKGDVSCTGSGSVGNGVTFIAEGNIKISGSNNTFTSSKLNMLFWSLGISTHGVYQIDMSGSGANFNGWAYAPGLKATYTGSSTALWTGCVYAEDVDISGSDFTFTGNGPGDNTSAQGKLVE
jgi:Flp pilus assembly protein TadG